MPNIWTISELTVTILSFIYAAYQGIKSSQLKRLVHSQTWDLYARANNATGAVQTAFKLYKEKYNENLDPEVLEIFAKSTAFNQDLFLDTIRHIYLSDPFDYKKVAKWIETGKLDGSYKSNFELIANIETRPLSWIEKLKKSIF